jgi:hypothetical protein
LSFFQKEKKTINSQHRVNITTLHLEKASSTICGTIESWKECSTSWRAEWDVSRYHLSDEETALHEQEKEELIRSA